MTGMGAGFVRGNIIFFHYLWHLPWIMLQPEIESGRKGEYSLRRLRSGDHRTIQYYFIIKRIMFRLRKEFLLKRNDKALSCNWGIYSNKRRRKLDTGTENPCRIEQNRHLLFQTFLETEQKRQCFNYSY